MVKMNKAEHENQTSMKAKCIPAAGVPSLFIVMTSGAGVLVHSMNLFAGSATTPMNITATVVPNCRFAGSATPISFGDYGPQNKGPLDATSTVQLRCVKGSSVSIAINNGLNPVGPQRRMSDGQNNYIDYQIYSDASRSTIWNTTSTFNYTASSSAPQTMTLYMRIPPGQTQAHSS